MGEMTESRPLLVGNWKMNGLVASGREIAALVRGLPRGKESAPCDIWVCPPATLLMHFATMFANAPISLGAQDCHPDASGANTGDISAEMLADAGAVAVIVGHSERRCKYGESNALVCAKASAAHRAGLTAIVCIGESAEQRRRRSLFSVLGMQLRRSLPQSASGDNCIIAYEPVWAIGTGLVPSGEQIVEVHAFIRKYLDGQNSGNDKKIPVLYGGSLGPGNADWLLRLEHVDGGLIGAASLKSENFLAVVDACP